MAQWLSPQSYPPDPEGKPLENQNIISFFPPRAGWIDVWSSLHPSEKGYTFDSMVNKMLSLFEQMRYDRVLFRSTHSVWVPEKITMIGTNQIRELKSQENGNPLFPSDHFGLVATFKAKPEEHTCLSQ